MTYNLNPNTNPIDIDYVTDKSHCMRDLSTGPTACKIIFYAACAAQATPIGCNTYSLQSDMVY